MLGPSLAITVNHVGRLEPGKDLPVAHSVGSGSLAQRSFLPLAQDDGSKKKETGIPEEIAPSTLLEKKGW